ncbi:MAG: hypothetical protein RMI79_05880 [Nitrososphaerota archaeon]|nr:hypothetical protein [Nitrososphaerota archaeon]
MNSNKTLYIAFKKRNNPEDSDGFENIIPILNEYRKIVISMQGFERKEILEAIRPLATRNISSTLIVYNGKYESLDDYDERLVIGQDG